MIKGQNLQAYNKNKTVVIDADSFAYRIGPLAAEQGLYNDFQPDTDTDFESEDSDSFVGEAISSGDKSISIVEALAYDFIDTEVEKIKKATKCDHAILVLTCGGLLTSAIDHLIALDPITYQYLDQYKTYENFRFGVAEVLEHAYKHNRAKLEPPAGAKESMIAMIKHFDVIIGQNCEADDIVCNLAKQGFMISAIDKDVLMQTKGVSYNYMKEEFIQRTESDTVFYKYFQAITGDPSDGYKGIPRVGPVGANKIINVEMTEPELFNATLEAYEEADLGIDECLATIRLADMHQVAVIDRDSHLVILYTPPEECMENI